MRLFACARALLLGAVLACGGAQAGAPPMSAAASAPASATAAAATAVAPASAPSLAASVALAAIPKLSGHVTDAAGMLEPKQRTALESVLADYEKRTGSQIAILLVSSTAPDPIEQYGIRVADAWKVGRKGVDDGVLLIVAKDNPKDLRRLRIEAGRGVQGTLTDAQSKRILQDTIAPHFRHNDYYGGLAAGVAAVTALLDKEHFAPPKSATEKLVDHAGSAWPFLLVAVIVMAILLRSRGGGGPRLRHSGSSWGNADGVALGALIGNALSQSSHRASTSGGDFSGGGGSSGGFSGGGGSFDGGGASGDW